MRKLLNTLYVTSENSYLSLDGENVVVFGRTKKKWGRVPLHNLEGDCFPFWGLNSGGGKPKVRGPGLDLGANWGHWLGNGEQNFFGN